MAPTFKLVTGAPKADLFVVPVFSGAQLGPGAELVDDAIGGTLAEFMTETDFEGKRGEVLAVPTGGRLGARAALLLGVGDEDTFDAAALRRAGAVLARRASRVASVATTLLDAARPDVDRGARRAGVRGRRVPRPLPVPALQVGGQGVAARARARHRARRTPRCATASTRGARIAEAVAWARDLINEPAAAKSPADVADLAKVVARASGLKVKVFAGEQLVRERMGGVIGVGNGSDRPPRFLRLEYAPPEPQGTLALVGKGVVFDSGGLSLKTAGGMETMKTDMSGAAAVIAAMSTLRDLGVKARVIGYVPLVENMPSGTAMRPGDVLTMRNGKTVEVLNTDAEGRLILADALSLASRGGRRRDHRPRHAHRCGGDGAGRQDRGRDGQRRRRGSTQVQDAADARGRTDVAPAVAGRVPPQSRLRDRRPAQHLVGRRRGHVDRRAVLEGVRRRRALGASRHRRHRAFVVGRRGDVEGRNRLRRAHAGRARIDVPGPGQMRNPMKRTVLVIALVACALARSGGLRRFVETEGRARAHRPAGQARSRSTPRTISGRPNDVIVDVGTKVTWHNTDAVTHNIKKSADASTSAASSAPIRSRRAQTYSFTFAKAGTFPYTCTIHAAMTGKIEVVAA